MIKNPDQYKQKARYTTYYDNQEAESQQPTRASHHIMTTHQY